MSKITEVLKINRKNFARVIRHNNSKNFIILNLSNNETLKNIDFTSITAFSKYVKDEIKNSNAEFAIGRYNEDRIIYNHSNIFAGNERRTIHLGVDIWIHPNTPIYCPINGKIHSFRNNIGSGDYGPTIIIEHELNGITFYTLYGHLTLHSLNNLYEGKQIKENEIIGFVGKYEENGNWPPHLHFQIISSINNMKGDFPGVASISEREKYIKNCPNPNLILNYEGLD